MIYLIIVIMAWLAVGAFGFAWFKVGVTKQDLTTEHFWLLVVAALFGPISVLTTLTFLPSGNRLPRIIFKARR